MKNLPNILTISRIIFLPPLLLMIYTSNHHLNISAVVLFIIISLTDFFDGYFARKQNMTSEFGKMLDPIADKLLVIGVLIILMNKGIIENTSIIPALLIIFREIFISGLREYSATINKIGSISVSQIGKIKTSLQLMSLMFMLFHVAFQNSGIFLNIGVILLWISMILGLISGYQYYRSIFN